MERFGSLFEKSTKKTIYCTQSFETETHTLTLKYERKYIPIPILYLSYDLFHITVNLLEVNLYGSMFMNCQKLNN